MHIFNLPDLGEGLPDAEIHEWFVKEGDEVTVDQPLVAMETAKAVVDVPCPEAGIIETLYGKPGDIIKTGEPLVAFQSSSTTSTKDKGTVVGNLEESDDISEDQFTIGTNHTRQKSTPAVRFLAKKMGVDIQTIEGSGEHGLITREDVEQEAARLATPPEGYEPLRGVRRAMLNSMTHSHQTVVPVSIFDEADIHSWSPEASDITVRLIRAIVYACQQEPSLNAWFNEKHQARRCFEEVHLGLAMDTEDGLFVPVIYDAANQSDDKLREQINTYKKDVNQRAIAAEYLKGATITLSNFGKFAGRFASPIIVPPSVAILAVGRSYDGVVSHQDALKTHRLLPLSLSFDHRAVTGGEATRFLGAVIKALEQTSSLS